MESAGALMPPDFAQAQKDQPSEGMTRLRPACLAA